MQSEERASLTDWTLRELFDVSTLDNAQLHGIHKVRDAVSWLDGFAKVFTTWRRNSLHRNYVERHLVEWAELVGGVFNASVGGASSAEAHKAAGMLKY